MKIAYKHLLGMLYEKPSINDLSLKLFQLGHEHEIENNIFDIEVTPNRGDCLSINGILRDLSIFYKVKNNKDIYEDTINDLELNFENNDVNACPKISFLKIDIDNPTQNYKNYLESYFIELSNNKTNFFTDISNYLSYETGQPTHCYDFKKMNGNLSFGLNKVNINFETLLNQTLNLKDNNKDYAFFLDDKVINLAGIIGGKNTACSQDTKTVLIECAFFEPEAIIGKSINYDIQSEAAYKFERGTNHNSHHYVLRRFIKIVKDHASILNLEIKSLSYKEIKDKELIFNADAIDKIIGYKTPHSQKKEFLQKLGFTYKEDRIIVPSHRTDIHNLNDIAEEIARVIGYDNIPSSTLNISLDNLKSEMKPENSIRPFLISKGFYETINFPFVGVKEKNSIKLDNPLDSNKPYMRTNLKDSLVENLLFNERRQKDSIKIFEISDIYYSQNITKKLLGMIVSGRVGNNYRDFAKKIDSKYLENLVGKFTSNDINIIEIPRDELNTKIKNPIFFVEIELNNLDRLELENINDNYFSPNKNFIKYKKISEYPSTYRDISFSLKDSSALSKLEGTLNNIENNLIKDIFIFDYYKDVKSSVTKIGYRLIFQSSEKTLTDDEVDIVMKEIMDKTMQIESVVIPGLKCQ